MKKEEAIALFGSASRVADALGISVQAVSKWGEDVPELRVYQIRCIAASMQAGQAS